MGTEVVVEELTKSYVNLDCAAPLGSPVDVRGVKYGYPYVDGKPDLTVPPLACTKYHHQLPGFALCDGQQPANPGQDGSSPGGGEQAARQGPALPGLPGLRDGGGAVDLLSSLLGGAQ